MGFAPRSFAPAFVLVRPCRTTWMHEPARLRTRVFDSPQLARTIVTRRVRKGRASTLLSAPGDVGPKNKEAGFGRLCFSSVPTSSRQVGAPGWIEGPASPHVCVR